MRPSADPFRLRGSVVSLKRCCFVLSTFLALDLGGTNLYVPLDLCPT